MPDGAMLASSDARDLEQEYVACRKAVLAMLRAQFPRVRDPEELYQEAWAKALERRANGGRITDLPGLIKLIAWRSARDQLRNINALPADPGGSLMTLQLDDGPTPDECAQVHLDAAVVRRVIDELGPRERAVIKLRFDLGMSSREIQEVLGVSAKRLEKIVTSAYGTVERQLVVDADGESTWSRRQRSLFRACLSGRASQAQVDRARKMVADDPHARATLRAMRTALDQLAVGLPLPILAEQQREHGIAVLDRVADGFASVREAIASAIHRGAAASPNLEPASGGIATLGAAGAAKVALVCMSIGGGAVVCIERGVFRHHDASPPATAKRKSGPSKPTKRSPAVVQVRVVKPRVASASTTPKQRPQTTNDPPAPSPAPAGSTEFGPDPTGSGPRPTVPAAAPVDGGGEFLP